MSDAWQVGVSSLLLQCRSGFLATTGRHGPEASMAPFAIYQGSILLHLSTLARHTKNIAQDSSIGFMVCTPEEIGQSPLSLPRLSLQGKASIVSVEHLQATKQAYLKRIPDADRLFDFSDFRLFQIAPLHIQWVGGFAAARRISVHSWHEFLSDKAN